MQLALELLAPAKNKDIGISAINCGADAVYIAGPSFGAREAAGNTIRDIGALARYAHSFGAKVYITVNTILYDSELEEAQRTIREAYEEGCDAVILQDLGILKMELPPISLFASTQCNIRTPEQARFLESLGLRRLILERALSLKEIKAIREATTCDLESFVHGALCVSYSGQCYLSQHLAGRSANRGCCVQACRSRYDLTDQKGTVLMKDKALLSLRDLNLSSRIGEMIEAGISSFKIEGRLKNESYVKNIVRYYREVLDQYIDRRCMSYRKSSFGNLYGGFYPDPEITFNRGYTQFFIDGKKDKWCSMDTAKSIGEEVGRVEKILNENSKNTTFSFVAEPNLRYPLTNGDGLCYVSGRDVMGMRADVVFGRTVITKKDQSLKPGVPLYRNLNLAFERELEKNMPARMLPVKVIFNSISSTSDTISSYYHIEVEGTTENGVYASITLDEEMPIAQHQALTEENLQNQFSKKTGHYAFHLDNIRYQGSIPFMPLSRMNTIRRELANKLEIQEEKEYRDHCSGLRTEAWPKKEETPDKPCAPAQKVRLNCANHLSRELYRSLGVEPDTAYELAPAEDMELMRTRYCIRFELGMCPRQGGGKASPLYLTNNGKRLEASFDCAKCEMVIKRG